MNWFSHITYTCKDMSQLLSDAMDRSLPWHMRLRMRTHLHICALCQRYKQQLTLMRAVLRKSGTKLNDEDRPNTPSLSPDTKARIQRALHSHRT